MKPLAGPTIAEGMKIGRDIARKALSRSKQKWDFAIGTTSRVPGSKDKHYLILDFDTSYLSANRLFSVTRKGDLFVIQKTDNGWHVFTNIKASLKHTAKLADLLGADKKWIEIAMRRGYFFLADKDVVQLPWAVERMVIYEREKKRDPGGIGSLVRATRNPRG